MAFQRNRTYQGSAGEIGDQTFQLIGLSGPVHELVRSWPGGPQDNAAWQHMVRGLWPWFAFLALIGVLIGLGVQPDRTLAAVLLVAALAVVQYSLWLGRSAMNRDRQAGVQAGQLTLEVQRKTLPTGPIARLHYERGQAPTTVEALLGEHSRAYVTLHGLTSFEVADLQEYLHVRLGREGEGDVSSG